LLGTGLGREVAEQLVRDYSLPARLKRAHLIYNNINLSLTYRKNCRKKLVASVLHIAPEAAEDKP
jgi:hypothetical protein